MNSENIQNSDMALLRRKTILEDKFQFFKELKQLMKDGKQEEAERLMNEYESDLDAMLDEMSVVSQRDVDRSNFPHKGQVFAKDDYVRLQMISEHEKEQYIQVSYECSYSKGIFRSENEVYINSLWEDFLQEYTFVCSIYDKNSNEYVGYCSIKDMRRNEWELAIELKEKYRHKGYGYHALSLMIEKLTALSKQKQYRARVDIDNYASQGLMKKLGAIPNGISEFLLHGRNLEEFQKENKSSIDDSIRCVAAEFQVSPEELLGHVLEYRLEME